MSNKPYIVNDIGYENKIIDGTPIRTYISQFVAPLGNGAMKAYEVYGVSPAQIAEVVSLFREWNESTQSPIGEIAEAARKQSKNDEDSLEEATVLIDKITRALPTINNPEDLEFAQAYLMSLEEKRKNLAQSLEASIAVEKKLTQ